MNLRIGSICISPMARVLISLLAVLATLPAVRAQATEVGVTRIAAGGSYTCAVTEAGAVRCWGYNNSEGQLGDRTTTDRHTPVDVFGLSPDAIHVSAAFSPDHVAINEPSRLTISLTNVADLAGGAILVSDFIDALPDDLAVAAMPNAASTCADANVMAPAAGHRITLGAGAVIPAQASCALSVNVVAVTDGPHVDVIPARSVQSALGPNSENINAILNTGFFPSPYCSWGAQGVSPIISVEFSGIANSSDPDYNHSPELEDFTAVVGTVSAGTVETLEVQARTWEIDDPTTGIAAYFDWNRDGDFDDAGEVRFSPILSGDGSGRTIEWQGPVSVPRPATGESTAIYSAIRMRVVALSSNNNDYPDMAPCGDLNGGGQAEDYTLIIYNDYIFADGFD